MSEFCIWNFGKDYRCSGSINDRSIFGNQIIIPMCEACFIRHKRVMEIAEKNSCNGEKALKIFYKENENGEEA